EEISPFLPHFPYNPKDLKFLGSPVDFIVFDGISNQELKEVIFLEIKTGNSKLNFNEKKLKEIIDNKKVCYREYRIKD
ncbi:MAG TPA: Holliday junction resolvase-like protein, partial [Spirochaetota bacterium]|nr:Holliday junction resolvase-like protein [Spirochaetota bacterium]